MVKKEAENNGVRDILCLTFGLILLALLAFGMFSAFNWWTDRNDKRWDSQENTCMVDCMIFDYTYWKVVDHAGWGRDKCLCLYNGVARNVWEYP